jgi:hypothetical protein
MVKKGVGRFYQGPISGIAGHALQDGRGFFSNDAGNNHPKVYSMETAGAREIAYLNRDGSRSMLGTLVVDIDPTAALGFMYGVQVALSTPAGAFHFNDIVQLKVESLTKGAGSTIDSMFGLRVGDIEGATNNWAIVTGKGQVMFGNYSGVPYTLLIDGNDSVILGKPGIAASATSGFVQIQKITANPNGGAAPATDHVNIVYSTLDQRIWIHNGSQWVKTAILTI